MIKLNLIVILMCLLHFGGNAQTIKISDDIELVKLSDKAYIHVSYYEIPPFGRVGANGLLLIDKGEAYLFDSPWDNEQTKTLYEWVKDSLHVTISTFIPNHWHEDCMGGLEYLQSKGVKSYANQMTIDIAKEKGLPVPEYGFRDSLSLKLHDMDVKCYFLGSGHSTDNIVVWISSEKILFAGCMVKDIHSKGLGNLSDADVKEWPATIEKVIEMFPLAEIVIPGHGEIGGKEVLIHTQELLEK